jgi:hypothetical protein
VRNPWLDFALLGVEAQQVIWLRSWRLAGGGPLAAEEARRMVAEKMIAAAQTVGLTMLGASPHRASRGYRTRVRANLRRLSR